MTATPWAPLSRRLAGLGPDTAPRGDAPDGLPGYVRGALETWTRGASPAPGSLHYADLQLRLHRDVIPDPQDLNGRELLDLVDVLLFLRHGKWRRYVREPSTEELRQILVGGGAAWTVNAAEDGLVRRIDPAVVSALEVAVEGTGTAEMATPAAKASEHLAAALRAAYGPDPDPDRAYDEAVLAVEAVACPLVSPNNSRSTLGTVIRDLTSQSERWALVIGDGNGQPAAPDRLIEMLRLLWEGQSRHAGGANSRRQNQAEAEAVVHLAAVVVQWLQTRVLYRR